MAQIADMRSPAARLRDALDVLAARWSDTREGWDDANSQNLEENHLKPLGSNVMSTLAATSHLAEVLAHAQRDCESF